MVKRLGSLTSGARMHCHCSTKYQRRRGNTGKTAHDQAETLLHSALTTLFLREYVDVEELADILATLPDNSEDTVRTACKNCSHSCSVQHIPCPSPYPSASPSSAIEKDKTTANSTSSEIVPPQRRFSDRAQNLVALWNETAPGRLPRTKKLSARLEKKILK